MRQPASHSAPKLTLLLFGGLSIRQADGPGIELPPQQSSTLLAYLALNLNRSIPRAELLALLWPESEPEKAQQSLRQCLRSLRLLLQQSSIAPASVLLATRADVRLNPSIVCTDVAEFESALEAAKQAAERAERISQLARAVELYRGELLPGYYQDCFILEQHRLAERHRQVLHQLIRELEAQGDLERALTHAQQLALLDPLSEEACSTLMRLYTLLGRPSAVLRQYQEWEARYCKEFGEPPKTDLRLEIGDLRKGFFPSVEQVETPAALGQASVPAQVSNRCEAPVPPVESRGETGEATSPLHSNGVSSSVGQASLPVQASSKSHKHNRFPLSIAAIAVSLLALLGVGRWALGVREKQGVGYRVSGVGKSSDPTIKPNIVGARSPRPSPIKAQPSTPSVQRPTPIRGNREQGIGNRKAVVSGQWSETQARGRGGEGEQAVQSKIQNPKSKIDPDPTLLWKPGMVPKIGTRTGQELWIAYYKLKPGDKGDEPTAMTTDAAGNIYITGFVNTVDPQHDVDYLTLKYSPEGVLLWEQRYNGPGHDLDRARSIVVDAAGSVYVTGESDGGKGHGPERLSGLDIATIKYDPDGHPSPTWPDVGFGVGVRRYAGPADGMDSGRKIALDDAGNVYVFGQSWGGDPKQGGTGSDFVLLKYDAGGNQQWVTRYPGGTTNAHAAKAMVVDGAGSAYVTGIVSGAAVGSPDAKDNDLIIIKYDTDGQWIWEKRYASAVPGKDNDDPDCMTLDREGNIVVVGYQYTGIHEDEEQDDYLVLKYSPQGQPLWARPYHWSGHANKAAAVVVDGQNSIYVTGTISTVCYSMGVHSGETDSVFENMGTLKYSVSGDLVWAKPYRGPGIRGNFANGLTLNSVGQLYVSGQASYLDPHAPNASGGDSKEYTTLEYFPDGMRQRQLRYRGSGKVGINWAARVVVDEDDNVIVTGQSDTGKTADIVTIKYKP